MGRPHTKYVDRPVDRPVEKIVYIERPPSPPPPRFDTEWRKIEWDKKDELLQHLMEYSRENKDIKQIRILLFGQVGAGKSSFVNAVDSIFKERLSQRASVGTGDTSHSLKYKAYAIKKKNEGEQGHYPFLFCDLMGLEEEEGIQEDDITMILKGHVKEGYTCNPATAISEEDSYYIRNPTPQDKVHVLVCVVPADRVDMLTQAFAEKIQSVTKAARDLDIPITCIITNIDKTGPVMQNDVKEVYKLKIVKAKMEEFSAKVGIPMCAIFPVKNYHEETDLNNDFDVLILKALQHMINVGSDHIEEDMLTPPPPTFDTEWRKIDWDKRDELLEKLKKYNRESEDIKQIRILLFGPVGAGKSSFVNSVDSIFKDRISLRASVGTGAKSHSLQYKAYAIKKKVEGKKCHYPFLFCDLMGLEEEKGIQGDDIKMILKGHVKHGYTCNMDAAISEKDSYYIKDPTPQDQVHVLVCVVPADKVEVLTKPFAEKVQSVTKAARDLGIPTTCIITNIDKTGPVMQKDVKSVYKLKMMKAKMEEFSARVDLPMITLFPVKNYHEENVLNNDADVLILNALQHMINVGDDYIDEDM